MNQILSCNPKFNQKYKKFFFTILIISLIACTISCINYLKFMHKIHSNHELSSKISNINKIINLSSNNYNTISSISYKIFDSFSNNYIYVDIIGFIEIPKINIVYPISKTLTDENLNLLPCKVCGPEINEFGNLCIAGHNFNNNIFFSNLFLLNKNDFIYIYDLYNNLTIYKIQNIYEVPAQNTECLDCSTNSLRELTLITCNNFNNKRLIIKAQEETSSRAFVFLLNIIFFYFDIRIHCYNYTNSYY